MIRPSGKKIFNYKETVEEYVQDCELNMECNCSSSKFSDKDHGHVVTVDLPIIKTKNWENCSRRVLIIGRRKSLTGKRQCLCRKKISSYSTRNGGAGIAEECFSEWRITLFKSIQEKVKKLKKKIKFKPVKNVLKDPTCLKDLKELKDQYVFVPIDKAANNVV